MGLCHRDVDTCLGIEGDSSIKPLQNRRCRCGQHTSGLGLILDEIAPRSGQVVDWQA